MAHVDTATDFWRLKTRLYQGGHCLWRYRLCGGVSLPRHRYGPRQPGAGAVERLVMLTVNGRKRPVDVMKQETLAMTLRYKLGLTGTKLGCDRAECGNCTVLIDNVPRYACSVLTHSVRHAAIRTIEGLANPDGTLHPVQEAFIAALGPQCGFCTPGQIMSTVGLLAVNPRPTRAEAAEALSGNLCRCGAYDHYLNAVMLAAQRGLSMAAYTLIGKDFIPPDLRGKVTAPPGMPRTFGSRACCLPSSSRAPAACEGAPHRCQQGAGHAGSRGTPDGRRRAPGDPAPGSRS